MSAWVQYFKSIPMHMDFEGQARAENLFRVIITLFGVVGLIWGYVIQQFSQTVYIIGAGFLMAALVTIPPWPMYRRKPLDWQKPQCQHCDVNPKTEPNNLSKSKKKKSASYQLPLHLKMFRYARTLVLRQRNTL